MLHQQVRRTNLALGAVLGALWADLTRAVVLCHVCLQLVGVGAGRWLPARERLRCIEVVWEVLGRGVAHFPAGWETCLNL